MRTDTVRLAVARTNYTKRVSRLLRFFYSNAGWYSGVGWLTQIATDSGFIYLLEIFIMTTNLTLLADQFVDMTFITTFTGMTDKWFYKLIQDGDFPKPIKLGRSSRWLKSEVESWMLQRIAQSRT